MIIIIMFVLVILITVASIVFVVLSFCCLVFLLLLLPLLSLLSLYNLINVIIVTIVIVATIVIIIIALLLRWLFIIVIITIVIILDMLSTHLTIWIMEGFHTKDMGLWTSEQLYKINFEEGSLTQLAKTYCFPEPLFCCMWKTICPNGIFFGAGSIFRETDFLGATACCLQATCTTVPWLHHHFSKRGSTTIPQAG